MHSQGKVALHFALLPAKRPLACWQPRRQNPPMPRITLISVTHNLLRPEALAFLTTSSTAVTSPGRRCWRGWRRWRR